MKDIKSYYKNTYRGWDGKIKITKDKIFIVHEGFVATLSMFLNREQKRFLEIDILQIKSILFRKAYLTNGYLYFHIEGKERPLRGYWDKYRFIGNRYTVGFTLFSNRRFEECKETLEKIILEQKERHSSNTYILEEENNKLKKYDFRDDVNQLKFVPKCQSCGAKHILKRGKLYICAYCNSTLFFES